MRAIKYRLSEKKMADKRFHHTEESILKVIEKDFYISAKNVAKQAHISRSTFYSHHGAVRMIIPDYEKYLLDHYKKTIHRPLNSKAPLKNLYLRTLFFMRANKRSFAILFKIGDTSTLTQIINQLKPRITRALHLPKNSNKMFQVYRSEVCELILNWYSHGMPESEIDNLLDQIMYLTQTMRTRLAPLLD